MEFTLLFFLSLTLSTVDGPPLPDCSVTAEEGETVILPVNLNLFEDPKLYHPTTEWRTEKGEVVHQHQKENEHDGHQVKSFTNKTSLFDKTEIYNGNVSLKITNVAKSDRGIYTLEVVDKSLSHPIKFYNFSLCVKEKGERGGSQAESSKLEQPSLGKSSGCSVSAEEGQTVILSVNLNFKLLKPTIRWKNEKDIIVHEYRINTTYNEDQDERFKGRTSLFKEEFKRGNFSLKIINVTKSDKGNYTCKVKNTDPKINEIYKVSLCVMEKGWRIITGPFQNLEESPNPEPKPSLTTGAIVGIVFGAAALISVAVFLHLKGISSQSLQMRSSSKGGRGGKETAGQRVLPMRGTLLLLRQFRGQQRLKDMSGATQTVMEEKHEQTMMEYW